MRWHILYLISRDPLDNQNNQIIPQSKFRWDVDSTNSMIKGGFWSDGQHEGGSLAAPTQQGVQLSALAPAGDKTLMKRQLKAMISPG